MVLKRIALLLIIMITCSAQAQELPVQEIKKQISSYKNDIRGPYYRIKWFCKDGSIREPRDPCPDALGGGNQHASYKEDVIKLGAKHHVFFGDILTNTGKEDFWDKKNDHSRLKQYQLGKYLASIDDGWILRKGQYYRGALQVEDEEEWGVGFYQWLLNNKDVLKENYFLVRQSLKDVPHNGDNNLAQLIRSESKVIAEEFPKFMNARIKIHGQPDKTDIKTVSDFKQKYTDELTPELKKRFVKLDEALEQFYAPINSKLLREQILEIKNDHIIKRELLSFQKIYEEEKSADQQYLITSVSDMLYGIRKNISSIKDSSDKLIVLDLSIGLENILLRTIQEWKPNSVGALMQKIYTLSYAAAGTGLIEVWEWEEIQANFQSYLVNKQNSISALNEFMRHARSVVEWSTATVKANYQEEVDRYDLFEPLAYGFIDDRIRSTVSLNLGESVSELGKFIAKESSMTNKVMELPNQSTVRGLNPGYAYGTLYVIEGSPENIEVDTKAIYVFQKPPSNLKPVAGIMTVSEGNLVSHVQLLARNLGIPNAALSTENLAGLQKYNGQKVFYAVSEKGNVILKTENKMTKEEMELFSKKERDANKITVPVDKIRLDLKKVLNMADVNANDSGKLCGPKAANLGQLKSIFPEQVVEGLVIPFGVFKDHMDQIMPTTKKTYWEFLNSIFSKADAMRKNGTVEKVIEDFQIKELEVLQNAIKNISLKKEFVAQLKTSFVSTFKAPIGKIPVFLRSDTNMEDLKEFTGAGLNLTLFNILSEEKIISGIKDVWASPYTERSFKWRQQYLLNPENVFPSILIIPSVDVDYSGVMITKGINLGSDKDLTVAFSRGAGGAVDGQSAETRLITSDSTSVLLAPARQPDFIRLPVTGGTSKHTATFENAIVNNKNINDIYKIADEIRKKIPKTTTEEYKGAYDVELGFKDNKLWLFQIRPFVENKRAKSSSYLTSITPKIDYTKQINSTTKL